MGIKTRLWERFRAFKAAATKILHSVFTNKKMVAEEDEELREIFFVRNALGVLT